MICFYIFYQCF